MEGVDGDHGRCVKAIKAINALQEHNTGFSHLCRVCLHGRTSLLLGWKGAVKLTQDS